MAEEIFHIQDAAFVRIERMDALIYFSTERVEFFDMRQQLATDLFLIGLREPGNLRDGLFERFDHRFKLANWRSNGPKNLERAKGIEPSYAAWEAAVLPLNDARQLVNKTGNFLHF